MRRVVVLVVRSATDAGKVQSGRFVSLSFVSASLQLGWLLFLHFATHSTPSTHNSHGFEPIKVTSPGHSELILLFEISGSGSAYLTWDNPPTDFYPQLSLQISCLTFINPAREVG